MVSSIVKALVVISMPLLSFSGNIVTDMELCVDAGLNCENGSLCAYVEGAPSGNVLSNEVFCLCPGDWKGPLCDIPNEVTSPTSPTQSSPSSPTQSSPTSPTPSPADSSIETGMEVCENTGLNCENGSVCVYQDGGSTFEVSCRCTDDWTGSSCETPKEKCGSTSVSCYNGGVCEETSDTATGYKCVCTKAFEGIHCEHELDSQFSSSGPGSESSNSSDESTENEETTENGVELPTSSVDSKGQASGVMTFLYVLLASLVCGTLFMAFKKRGERNTIDEKFDRNSELDLSYEVRDREVV